MRGRVRSAVVLAALLLPAPLLAKAERPVCLLTAEENAGTLAMIGDDGRIAKRLTIGERPHEIAVSADRRTAYVSQFGLTDYDSQLGTPGTRVVIVDLRKGLVAGQLDLPEGVRAPHGVQLRPGAPRELYVNAERGGATMLVYDVRKRVLLRRFTLPGGTHNFVFAKDGASLYAFAGANGVFRIDAVSGGIIAAASVGTPVRGLALAPDGTVLAGGRGFVALLAGDNLRETGRLNAPEAGQILYLARLPDGSIAAPSLATSAVTLFAPDGHVTGSVKTGRTPIKALPGPHGLLYVDNVEDDHISVLGSDGSIQTTIGGLTTPNGMAWGECPQEK